MEDREVGREIKLRNTLKYCLVSYTHRPETCGPQGIVLQVCSCAGLVLKSQSWLCFLSLVRQRASLICKPFPQEREHWGSKAGRVLINLWNMHCNNLQHFPFHSFPWPLTALHSVVNHCGWHSPISHSWTAAGLSICAHSLAGATLKSFPLFLTQIMSRLWVPFPHGTLHWKD